MLLFFARGPQACLVSCFQYIMTEPRWHDSILWVHAMPAQQRLVAGTIAACLPCAAWFHNFLMPMRCLVSMHVKELFVCSKCPAL
jgi:uncharacterized membrane protein